VGPGRALRGVTTVQDLDGYVRVQGQGRDVGLGVPPLHHDPLDVLVGQDLEGLRVEVAEVELGRRVQEPTRRVQLEDAGIVAVSDQAAHVVGVDVGPKNMADNPAVCLD